MECLNTAPIIKACHLTGIGAMIPEEVCNPAKELCQAVLNQLVIHSGFQDEIVESLKNISDETITKVFAGLVSRGEFEVSVKITDSCSVDDAPETIYSLSFKWGIIRTPIFIMTLC